MSGERQAGERLSVLIVDDNQDLADSLSTLMGIWGMAVCVAYDGVSGLQLARDQRPDCAFLDIGLPGMDGYELARQLRLEPDLRRTKLIAHTAYSSEDHVRKIKAAGFDYRLTKPVAPGQIQELLQMIEQVKKIAQETEQLARQNVEIAGQTSELMTSVKEDVKEMHEDIREIKEDIKEVKEDIKEVKAKVEKRP